MKSITIKQIIEEAFNAGAAHMLCSHEGLVQNKPDKKEYTKIVLEKIKKMKVVK